MTAPKTSRARQQRRQNLTALLLAVPLPVLAFGLGALAVHLSVHDGPRPCLDDVQAFVRQAGPVLPRDPELVSLVYRRVTTAAQLCEQGRPDNAQEVLDALRESLRV